MSRIDRLRQQSESLQVPLSVEAAEQLLHLEELLADRAFPLKLISSSDVGRLRDRHILDCLRAAGVVEDGDRDAYDLGSGAGLPGIVVAVARPALQVVLVERRRSRAAFLELAVDELGLDNLRVAPVRFEELYELVDLCFARALAPLARAWRGALPLLRPNGRLVYFSGRGSSGERPSHHQDTRVVPPPPVLESAGPLVIMTR